MISTWQRRWLVSYDFINTLIAWLTEARLGAEQTTITLNICDPGPQNQSEVAWVYM